MPQTRKALTQDTQYIFAFSDLVYDLLIAFLECSTFPGVDLQSLFVHGVYNRDESPDVLKRQASDEEAADCGRNVWRDVWEGSTPHV